MAMALSYRPLTAEARDPSRVSSCEFCGGQSGTVAGFSPCTSVYPCHQSINAPYIFTSSTRYPYKKDKSGIPGNIPKCSVVSEIWDRWTEKYFHCTSWRRAGT